jgi:hypothetical protein
MILMDTNVIVDALDKRRTGEAPLPVPLPARAGRGDRKSLLHPNAAKK